MKLPKTIAGREYIPQRLRAGSSPGANRIEANGSIGDKDFNMKIKACRREAKESSYGMWVTLLANNQPLETGRRNLRQEAKELFDFKAIPGKRS